MLLHNLLHAKISQAIASSNFLLPKTTQWTRKNFLITIFLGEAADQCRQARTLVVLMLNTIPSKMLQNVKRQNQGPHIVSQISGYSKPFKYPLPPPPPPSLNESNWYSPGNPFTLKYFLFLLFSMLNLFTLNLLNFQTSFYLFVWSMILLWVF